MKSAVFSPKSSIFLLFYMWHVANPSRLFAFSHGYWKWEKLYALVSFTYKGNEAQKG